MRTSNLFFLASMLTQVYGMDHDNDVGKDQRSLQRESNFKRTLDRLDLSPISATGKRPFDSPEDLAHRRNRYDAGYHGDTENGHFESPDTPFTPTPNVKSRPSLSPGSGYKGGSERSPNRAESPDSPLTPNSAKKSRHDSPRNSQASPEPLLQADFGAPGTPVLHAVNAQPEAHPLAQVGYETPVGQGIQMHTPIAPHQGIHFTSSSSDSFEGGATTGESDSEGDFQLHFGPLVF